MVRRYLRGAYKQEQRERNLERAKKRKKKKQPPAAAGANNVNGIISAVHSQRLEIQIEDRSFSAPLQLNKADTPSSGFCIGDQVIGELLEGDRFRLLQVRERRSWLARTDPANPNRHKLLAANVDLAVLVVPSMPPPFKTGLVDRFLITAAQGRTEPLLCMHKWDLVRSQKHEEELHGVARQYQQLGCPTIQVSSLNGEGIAELEQHLRNQVSVFVGHSGAGKSTLLNRLDPQTQRATRAVRAKDARGRHTTTSSQWNSLPQGGWVIDTPGFRSLGIWQVRAEEVQDFFPEIRERSRACAFRNCRHREEANCAVRKALADNVLTPSRFAAYTRIMQSLPE